MLNNENTLNSPQTDDNDAYAPELDVHAEEHENHHEQVQELSKDAMIVRLEEILNSPDLDKQKEQVNALKEAFKNLVLEEIDAVRKKVLEEGDDEEDFVKPTDSRNDKFDGLVKKYFNLRTEQKKQREKTLNDNLTKKLKIVELLKALSESGENIPNLFEKYNILKEEWYATGGVPAQHGMELLNNYIHYRNKFLDNIKMNKELRELDIKRNLEAKNKLCEKAEALANEPSINKSIESYKLLQDKWNEIGTVGKDHGQIILARFKTAGEKLFERKKEYIKKQNEQRKQNLVAKIALCDKLEVLVKTEFNSHQKWADAHKQVDELTAEWQKTGYTSKEDKGQAWERFKDLKQKFFAAKDAYYDRTRKEQNKNLELKTKLCEKAEALKDSTDWRNTTEEFKKLQAEWKNTGPVSRKVSDKIWTRFRTACDEFFNRKAQHHATIEDQFKQNVEKRMEVAAKIDRLEIGDDAQLNINALRALQDEYKSIGEVNRTDLEKVNVAYHKAVSKITDEIKNRSGEGSKLFYQLKYEQLLQTVDGKKQIERERFELKGKINRLNAEINTLENNLGFFANSKKASTMVEEYRQKINHLKDEVKKLQEHLKYIPH